jgi:hypothetical protein
MTTLVTHETENERAVVVECANPKQLADAIGQITQGGLKLHSVVPYDTSKVGAEHDHFLVIGVRS